MRQYFLEEKIKRGLVRFRERILIDRSPLDPCYLLVQMKPIKPSALSHQLHQYIYRCFSENRAWYNAHYYPVIIYLQEQIPLWRGSKRLNLLHRQARNLFSPTNSVFLCSKRLFRRSEFRSLQPMSLLHVLPKNVQVFILYFQASKSFPLTQNEQDFDCVHSSQISNKRVKIPARKFITSFPDATVNNKICFLNFWINENDKNAWILPFVQSNLSIENEPKVVTFITRWAFCFCV